MKYKNRVKRLERRRKDYENMVSKDTNCAKSCKRPGSLNK